MTKKIVAIMKLWYYNINMNEITKRQKQILINDIRLNINRLLYYRKWTQKDLAKLCDVSESKLSRLLRNGQMPDIYTIVKICIAFDVDIMELLTFDGEKFLKDEEGKFNV